MLVPLLELKKKNDERKIPLELVPKISQNSFCHLKCLPQSHKSAGGTTARSWSGEGNSRWHLLKDQGGFPHVVLVQVSVW